MFRFIAPCYGFINAMSVSLSANITDFPLAFSSPHVFSFSVGVYYPIWLVCLFHLLGFPGYSVVRYSSSSIPKGLLFWYRSIHQKIAGSIPGEGTYQGCESGPHLGHIWEAIDWCFSLSLSHPFSSL